MLHCGEASAQGRLNLWYACFNLKLDVYPAENIYCLHFPADRTWNLHVQRDYKNNDNHCNELSLLYVHIHPWCPR
jgi:hypothetical protein